jgi:hypothetical protein
MTEKDLIENVKKAINPTFTNWVLFSNGTYIILADSIETDKKNKAIEIMKEYGPVFAGSPAGDITVTTLNLAPGWSVGGHYYGMYTYVDQKEMKPNPTDLEVGLYGRQKRDKDGKELNLIYLNE